MTTCAVKWCGKSSRNSNYKKDGLTFHRFPNCAEQKSQWIDATGRDGWFPTKNSVICSRHFTEDSFHIMKNRRRVMDSAVPTLYLPILAPTPITKQKDNLIKIEKTDLPSSLCTELDPLDLLAEIPSTSKNTVCDQPVKRGNRSISPLADSPSAYDTPKEKRLCRRVIDLKNIVRIKNIKLRKVRDCNRRLRKKIESLKSLLVELEKKEKSL